MPLTTEEKLEFVANVLKNATAFSVDFKQVAHDNGISRSDNAMTKFKGIIDSTAKYTLISGKVYAKDSPDVPADPTKATAAAAGRAKKADGKTTSKKDGAKATPKKCKVEEAGDADVKNDGDGEEDGEEAA